MSLEPDLALPRSGFRRVRLEAVEPDGRLVRIETSVSDMEFPDLRLDAIRRRVFGPMVLELVRLVLERPDRPVVVQQVGTHGEHG